MFKTFCFKTSLVIMNIITANYVTVSCHTRIHLLFYKFSLTLQRTQGSTHQKGEMQSMLSNREMLHEKEPGICHINKCPCTYIYHIYTHTEEAW